MSGMTNFVISNSRQEATATCGGYCGSCMPTDGLLYLNFAQQLGTYNLRSICLILIVCSFRKTGISKTGGGCNILFDWHILQDLGIFWRGKFYLVVTMGREVTIFMVVSGLSFFLYHLPYFSELPHLVLNNFSFNSHIMYVYNIIACWIHWWIQYIHVLKQNGLHSCFYLDQS